MGAKEKKIFVMHCDICDKTLDSDVSGECLYFATLEEAHDGANNQDWELVNGKWYCELCIGDL